MPAVVTTQFDTEEGLQSGRCRLTLRNQEREPERDGSTEKGSNRQKCKTKLSEGAGLSDGKASVREEGTKPFSAQLLCSMQQLCVGISESFFSDHGFFL